MKIAYIVLKSMPFSGGVEKCIEEIGSRLSQRGHKIIVYTMRHYGVKDGEFKGMIIKTVPTIKSRSLEKITASFIATIKQCFEKDIDVVHFPAFGPSMFNFIPRLIGRKVIVQGQGIEWKRSKWGFLGKCFLMITEMPSVIFPNVVTVVSKVQQKYLRNRYRKESIYIPSGVNSPILENPDLIKRYGLKGNDYILFAARLVKEKGAHYLIKAYKKLDTNVKLIIAGDAKHEENYKAELYKLAGENKNIIFTGFATGKLLFELFSNCYLFVLPSEIEGLSTALLEAMSYGNCCLVSDIPENLEALNGIGYSFKNKNVDDLADKLDFLLKNPEAVNSVKKKAQSYVIKNYSWDSIALEYERLYQSLLETK